MNNSLRWILKFVINKTNEKQNIGQYIGVGRRDKLRPYKFNFTTDGWGNYFTVFERLHSYATYMLHTFKVYTITCRMASLSISHFVQVGESVSNRIFWAYSERAGLLSFLTFRLYQPSIEILVEPSSLALLERQNIRNSLRHTLNRVPEFDLR